MIDTAVYNTAVLHDRTDAQCIELHASYTMRLDISAPLFGGLKPRMENANIFREKCGRAVPISPNASYCRQ